MLPLSLLAPHVPPFLHEFPEPGREAFDGGIPFRTEYTIVSHSLHIVQLWRSVSVPSYCKKLV